MGRMKLPNPFQSHQTAKQQVIVAPHTPSLTPPRTHNLLCHSHASPFDFHLKENISTIEDNLLTKEQTTYLTLKDTSNHESFRNKIEPHLPPY